MAYTAVHICRSVPSINHFDVLQIVPGHVNRVLLVGERKGGEVRLNSPPRLPIEREGGGMKSKMSGLGNFGAGEEGGMCEACPELFIPSASSCQSSLFSMDLSFSRFLLIFRHVL